MKFCCEATSVGRSKNAMSKTVAQVYPEPRRVRLLDLRLFAQATHYTVIVGSVGPLEEPRATTPTAAPSNPAITNPDPATAVARGKGP
jgi:hypothetical protein